MARINMVNLIGKVTEDALDSRFIEPEKTDGEKMVPVTNFHVKCYDPEDKRFYKIPVAAWGADMVEQCEKFLKKGSLVCVQGELRYKFHYNKKTKQMEKVFTTVKASTIEFLSKKLKDEKQTFYYFTNDVMLLGNLVEDPIVSEDGSQSFVIAVDRLIPKEEKINNYNATDYVHLVVRDKSLLTQKLQKGSTAIVKGSLMTRQRNDSLAVPRVVVNVKEIVGR